MSVAEVASGVCGFHARVACEVDDAYNVAVHIESECAHVRAFAERLASVSVLQEMRKPMPETAVYQAAGQSKMHAACPVPCAALKAIEVAAGLALAADVTITLRRE